MAGTSEFDFYSFPVFPRADRRAFSSVLLASFAVTTPLVKIEKARLINFEFPFAADQFELLMEMYGVLAGRLN